MKGSQDAIVYRTRAKTVSLSSADLSYGGRLCSAASALPETGSDTDRPLHILCHKCLSDITTPALAKCDDLLLIWAHLNKESGNGGYETQLSEF